MENQRFNEALLKAIDIAFGSLGKSCEQALYFHLGTTFHIEKTEIPEKVVEFDNALRMIFKEGAVFLEKLILEKLLERLRVELDRESCSDFVETISKVKNMISKEECLSTISDLSEVVLVTRKRGGAIVWDRRLGCLLLTTM